MHFTDRQAMVRQTKQTIEKPCSFEAFDLVEEEDVRVVLGLLVRYVLSWFDVLKRYFLDRVEEEDVSASFGQFGWDVK